MEEQLQLRESCLNTPVGGLVRGPSVLLSSSVQLGWYGVTLEHYLAEPGERAELPVSYQVVKLANSTTVCRCERIDWRGNFRPYLKAPGTFNVFAEGMLPPIRSFNDTELLVCAFEPRFLRSIAEEQDSPMSHSLQSGIGIQDESAAAIIRLLHAEVKSGAHFGPLYTDHLAHALAIRLLKDKTSNKHFAASRMAGFPSLNRAIERMEDEFRNPLNLKTLAEESGYSRNHFLRMFRLITNISPHQYLLRLRIRQAKLLMKSKRCPILEIAIECGFASHAQFSRAFRRLEGMSPSDYCRSL